MVRNDLIEADLRRELKRAEVILRELQREYKGDESYYRDHLDFMAEIREHLASMP